MILSDRRFAYVLGLSSGTVPGGGRRRATVSSVIDGSAIDNVLRDAVERGAVPNVVAVAADRDGVIYRGAAGPRTPGADRSRSTRTSGSCR